MSKMKVDPAICMKTNHKDKLSCVNKAKRVRFGRESCSITRLAQTSPTEFCCFMERPERSQTSQNSEVCAPERRHMFGVAEQDPDFLRRGIRVRQFGQRIIKLYGGKRIHPSWCIPGGVERTLDAAQRDEIAGWVPEAIESVQMALGRLKSLLDSFPDEIAHLGRFPSFFLATVGEDGGLEYYDGRIRIVDNEGNVAAESLDPRRYQDFLAEASEEWSYMKFPYYKALGYPGGMYRVGPLARLNVAKHAGTPLADREVREFKQRSTGSVAESIHYHLARLIEMLHSVERIAELMWDPELLGQRTVTRAMLNRTRGIGSCEAPRGTLFHDYEVDETGLMLHANLLIATSQNNLAINRAVEQAARRFVNPLRLEEGMLNRVEAAVRCFDPCLSCSTHALGQMPMIVEIRRTNGDIVQRIERH